MRKLLLIASITLLSNSVNAQFFSLNFRYGAQVSLGFSTINEVKTQTSTSQQSTAIAGKAGLVNLGLIAEKGLSDHFAVHAGLLYAMKGAKDASINYAEIPLSIVYYKGEGHGIFMNVGPYLGYALGGKGVTIGKEPDSTSTNLGVKQIDFGLQFGLGIETRSGWIIKGNAELGLSDMNMQSGANVPKLNNGAFMLTIGWLFGGESMYDM